MKVKMPFKTENISRKVKMPFKRENSRKAKMMRIARLMRGIASGAAVMYFFDPQMGARRRALLRDKAVRMFNRTSDRLETATEMAADRAKGIAAETVRRFNPQPVSDEILVARVRSEMGRYLQHPHAVEVTANNGHITLTGNILAHEVQPLLTKLKNMQFVQSIDNRLQAHEEAANVPDFQRGIP
jgi:osmotically-inducible protein OsmY